MTYCIFTLRTFFWVVAPLFDEVVRYEMAGKSTITKKGPETAQSARELAPVWSCAPLWRFVTRARKCDWQASLSERYWPSSSFATTWAFWIFSHTQLGLVSGFSEYDSVVSGDSSLPRLPRQQQPHGMQVGPNNVTSVVWASDMIFSFLFFF